MFGEDVIIKVYITTTTTTTTITTITTTTTTTTTTNYDICNNCLYDDDYLHVSYNNHH